ncbi:E3 ubiquitin-protein ligase prt6 [Asimina triloba]
MACGAGIGIFLLIKKTRILVQRSAWQALWHSVYLDTFGEEDIDMRRGKPLYLNEERYATLTHVVALHGLDQMSEVLWKTTFDMDFTI